MRKVDKLGRIVIPMKFRKKYGFTDGAGIEFIDEGYGVTVKRSDKFCKLCGVKMDENAKLPLCDDCIATVREYEK